MQFQYQEQFSPVLVPPPVTAPLPQFLGHDYIEQVPEKNEGFTYLDPISWSYFKGITEFVGQENFVVANSPEQFDIFEGILVVNPPISVKNWNLLAPDFIPPLPDTADIQSVFECRRPIAAPSVTNDLSLIEYYNLTVRLDVKKAVDSGTVAALSTDASGTPVTFNKAFKDIDSVTATVQETTGFVVVVDFVDVPNPTGFKVYVFDRATGARASKTVYWAARGII